MVRGWWMRLPGMSYVWHTSTITHGPDIRPIGISQEWVHDYSASFLCARERRDKRTGYGSGSPHQSAAWNWNVIGQRDIVVCHALDSGVKTNFNAAPREHLLGVSSQTFTQFRQD